MHGKVKAMLYYFFGQIVAGVITTLALVTITFALFGQLPPQSLLVGSSMGGALSPLLWKYIRIIRDRYNTDQARKDLIK